MSQLVGRHRLCKPLTIAPACPAALHRRNAVAKLIKKVVDLAKFHEKDYIIWGIICPISAFVYSFPARTAISPNIDLSAGLAETTRDISGIYFRLL